MSQFSPWSLNQPTLWEETAEELISNNDIKRSIVLSMRADDDDWRNYRRRSSGGTAQAVLHQSRSGSRRTSRDESQPRLHNQQLPTPQQPNMDPQTLLDEVKARLESSMAHSQSEPEDINIQSDVNRSTLNPFTSDIRQNLPNDGRAFRRLMSVPTAVSSESIAEEFIETEDEPDYGRGLYPWLRDAATQCNIKSNESKKITSAFRRLSNTLPRPRNSRAQSNGAIFSIDETRAYTSPTSRIVTDTMPELEGKVVLEPTVLDQAYEYFTGLKQNDTGDIEAEDQIVALNGYDRSRRRACIVSTLDLGESLDIPDDESVQRKSSYPGDLVLHTGQALRKVHSIDDQYSMSRYSSESSLIDEASPTSNHEKSKSIRLSRGSFLKLWKPKKNESESVETVLLSLKTSEFKDERLSNLRHQHWAEVFKSRGESVDELSHSDSSKCDAIWEVFTNECVFLVDHLMVLKHVFMEPLKKCQVEGFLMDVEPARLFGNLDHLCHLSLSFCREFINMMKDLTVTEFSQTSHLCDCLDRMTSRSMDGDIYHTYVLNYRSAVTYLDNLRDTLDAFTVFETHCAIDRRCNKLALKDILVAPMQHWTRLPLLLKRLQTNTEDSRDRQRLEESMNNVTSSLKVLENKMEWLRSFERVKEIQEQLIWPVLGESDNKSFVPESLRGMVNLTPPDDFLCDQLREIVYEGPLIFTERDSKAEVYLFLFNDLLLLTKIKHNKKVRERHSIVERSDSTYNVMRQPIPVDGILVHDIGQSEAQASGMKNVFVIMQKNSFHQIVGLLTFQAYTHLAKKKWLSRLRDCKEKLKDSNNNTSSSLSRQESLKQLLTVDDHSSLLKNSQVLTLTSATSTSLLNQTGRQIRPRSESLAPGLSAERRDDTDSVNTRPHSITYLHVD